MGELLKEYNVFSAFGVTLALTVLAGIGSMVLGTIVAIMRVSPVALLNKLGALYVNIVRNTPLTLIIVFCSVGMVNNLGINLSDVITTNNFRWAVVGLSVYHAAFICEAIRSGVNTVPVGQAEAARSIGLTFGQSLKDVVLPQAMRGAITPLGNTFIALCKNTTVASAIGVAEAAYMMNNMIEFNSDLNTAIFLLIALGFVILTLPMGLLTTSLSKRLAVKR